MIQTLGTYILAITASALALGIFSSFFDQKKTIGALIRMAGGIWMVCILVSGVEKLDLEVVLDEISEISEVSQMPLEQGANAAEEAKREIIIQKIQSYILDKASFYDLRLEAQIRLSDDDPPVPAFLRVTYHGREGKAREMAQMIEEELGIPEEDQQWIKLD